MKHFIITGILIFNLIEFQSNAHPSRIEATLTVHASGFKNNIGQALLRLFRKEDKVPTQPFLVLKGAIINNEVTFTVPNIPYADYAAIVVHDQNANGEIDHSWGMPSEPLGFSNNWKLSMFSGMPTFDKLKFTYNDAHNQINIKIDN